MSQLKQADLERNNSSPSQFFLLFTPSANSVMPASQVVLVVKNLPVKVGDVRDVCLIPGLERSSGEGNGSLLQYSCLERSMDRGAWWAAVHRVTKSQTRLK